MNNTVVRTLSGAVYGALIFLCLLINGYLFAALIIFMMCAMMAEFYKMTMGEPSIKIEGPENYIDRIGYEVEDGVLKLSFDGRQTGGKVVITAQSETLNMLSIRGAGDFDAPYGIVTPVMDIDIQGAGDIDLKGLDCLGDVSIAVRGAGDIDISELACQCVKVEVMGAGDVVLKGDAASADLSIKGAGDIDITGLYVDDVKTSVQGVGSIRRK